MKYENVYWHDGNIKSINNKFPVSGKERASIEISFELYKSHDSTDLQDYSVVFPSVKEIFQSVDFDAIVEHIGPGSVDWVDQKEVMINNKKVYKYTISLCGGRMIIFSGKARIKRTI